MWCDRWLTNDDLFIFSIYTSLVFAFIFYPTSSFFTSFQLMPVISFHWSELFHPFLLLSSLFTLLKISMNFYFSIHLHFEISLCFCFVFLACLVLITGFVIFTLMCRPQDRIFYHWPVIKHLIISSVIFPHLGTQWIIFFFFF